MNIYHKITRKIILKVSGDLHKADLRGVNLRGADLRDANLRRADLRRTDLRWANLQWANLQEANLQEADLRDADLQKADLQKADLQKTDLRWANLRRADLRDVNLRGTDLRGASGHFRQLHTGKYLVTITETQIVIGCKNYSIAEWFSFTDNEISKFAYDALDQWGKYKKVIKILVDDLRDEMS